MSHPWMLAALSVPLAGLALADETPTQLEPVVVTATRTAEPQDTTLASVTVIDRSEIERRQARSVPDLLRGLPGVSITRSGGPGHQSSIFLRGTSADHVLMLVDGVKIGSATTGTASLEDLPIEEIERIEVVRGPRSSLYGSEAIGGVIQVFTRRGGGDWSPRLTLSGGTLHTTQVAAGISGGGERGWVNLGASLDRTHGINACSGRSTPFASCGVEQDDRDPYRNLGLSLRAGYRLNAQAELEVNLLRTEGQLDFDGSAFAGNVSRSEQQVLGAKAIIEPLAPWTLTLAAGQSLDNYRSFFEDPDTDADERFVDQFETTRDSLSLQNDWRLAEAHLATLGLDYRVDHVSGSVDYSRDSRDNLGVFGEYQASLGAVDLKLSLRQDEDGELGGHGTGNAALGYLFDTGLRILLAYGTAFKAPSFNDLYYPNYGNPNLDPERSRSWELGIAGELPIGPGIDGRWDLSLYETDIDDLISYDAALSAAANVQRARIRGLEATTRANYLDWSLQTSLTLLDPENCSPGPNQGNLLPRRPEQSLEIDLERRFDRWSAGATLFVSGRRYDDLANKNRLDGYALLDLRAEYRINPALRLQARLENVLDEEYETAYLYNQLGRSVYLTLRYAL
ncbi:TonB-dependent vitamin B12 receptor [Allochromatium palmeri]|uniref:TonB-dependent vitamin B12 receptor n=1 Tax=Allochromatium palmeri TaxID=231048 RepID=A0A6N8EDB2_9GAMM|nr:TonB-dependent vitamin B12 receptor [Allochromatium palmeri]MTW21591.1 TonB-dependent vitamin B12 receptor [Allochromatium palmeri]